MSWESVNVVFMLTNRTGYAGNLVVTESIDYSRITQVAIQKGGLTFGNTNVLSGRWAGYEFWGSATPNVEPMRESWAQWQIPPANAPWWGACWNPYACAVSAWVGLSAGTGGLGGAQQSCQSPPGCIVQAGTFGDISCSFFQCIGAQWTWYEFLPAQPVYCRNNHNAGDWVWAEAYSHYLGGGDPNSYTVNVYDNNGGCSSTQQRNDMGTAYYSQFVVETPHNGFFNMLASFGSVNFGGGTLFYSGNYRSVLTPYSNGNGHPGWWNQFDINCYPLGQGSNNADPSGVDSNGNFAINYHNSGRTDNCYRS